MRTLIAAVLVGIAVGLFAKAALACDEQVYQPTNDQPQVQQPDPGQSS